MEQKRETKQKYAVIASFHDAEDNFYFYKTGGTYPRKGYDAAPDRVKELSGKDNAAGRPVIK